MSTVDWIILIAVLGAAAFGVFYSIWCARNGRCAGCLGGCHTCDKTCKNKKSKTAQSDIHGGNKNDKA